MTLVHLDTDFGGDIDDLCALAFLLSRPDVELSAVTTNTEDRGVRAGYARFVLDLAGRARVPVAAGADRVLGCFRLPAEGALVPDEGRYWPEAIAPLSGPLEAALDLLEDSIRKGAVVVAIGACTNLARVEARAPGLLRDARLVLMGGFVTAPRNGFPQWTREMDWNFQVDVESARRVLEASTPLLVPIAVTAETALRRADLDMLRRGGPIARLIATQAVAFAEDEDLGGRYGPSCAALPGDFINFQHDPLACALAVGWHDGVSVGDVRLRNTIEDGWLVQTPSPEGERARLVRGIDGAAFDRFWLKSVSL